MNDALTDALVGLDQVEHWPTGRLLSTAARLAEHTWNSYLSRWSLNHNSFGMMMMLAREPHSQRSLAQHTHLQDQTVARMVERLERIGYVTRSRNPADRRSMVVTLTEQGRRAVKEALEGESTDAGFRASLGDQGEAAFRRHLVTLVHDLAAHRIPGLETVDANENGKEAARTDPR